VARSTLSDANSKQTRAAVFAALFGVLSRQATAALKREGDIMVRLARFCRKTGTHFS